MPNVRKSRESLITIAEPSIGNRERRNVMKAVRSGWVSSRGEFIGRFEEAFARLHGMRYGVSTHNGTCALHLALAALDIGAGDEVIIPTLTFVASANAVRYCGAKAVFVDSHPDYWGMDPEQVEKAITPRTKAIMIVHLYGHACDMTPILKLAKRRKIAIIEDNAEGLGTFYRGKRTGTFSTISCFSFYGNKVMTTGEGGMCLTQDRAIARKLAILRDHGMNPERRYWHDVIGFNYRMTNMQAAIGVAQLERLGEFLKKRERVAAWYDEALKPLADQGRIQFQPKMAWSTQNYWMYSLLLPGGARSRDAFIAALRQRHIDSRPFFHPLHHFPAYRGKRRFPVAEALSSRGVNLPMHVNLTRSHVRRITATVQELLGA